MTQEEQEKYFIEKNKAQERLYSPDVAKSKMPKRLKQKREETKFKEFQLQKEKQGKSRKKFV